MTPAALRESLGRFWRRLRYPLQYLAISVAVAAVLGVVLLMWPGWLGWRPAGIRLLFDGYDIAHAYMRGSSWVVSNGVAGEAVRSEYPPLAALVFGLCRWLAVHFPLLGMGTGDMIWWWMVLAVFGLSCVLQSTARHLSRAALALWVLPASLYFTLYRFDFYPAAATFAGLLLCKRDRWSAAALCFGLAIGLKGYLGLGLPAFAAFLAPRMPWRRAVLLIGIAVAPFVFSNLAIAVISGWEAALWPYTFQALRGPNGESSFDAAVYLVRWMAGAPIALEMLGGWRWFEGMGHVAQVAAALLALAYRPATVEELAKAFLFCSLAFWNFATFSSPQFVLWLIPMLCFIPVGRTFWLGVVVITLDYVCFPVLFDSRAVLGSNLGFEVGVVGFTAARFALMISAAQSWPRPWWKHAGRTGMPAVGAA